MTRCILKQNSFAWWSRRGTRTLDPPQDPCVKQRIITWFSVPKQTILKKHLHSTHSSPQIESVSSLSSFWKMGLHQIQHRSAPTQTELQHEHPKIWNFTFTLETQQPILTRWSPCIEFSCKDFLDTFYNDFFWLFTLISPSLSFQICFRKLILQFTILLRLLLWPPQEYFNHHHYRLKQSVVCWRKD